MTPFQKIIKYGAIAFGIYLCFIIISAVIFGLTATLGIIIGIENSNNDNIIQFSETYDNVRNLDIDISVSKLYIKGGESFKVEASNVSNKFYAKINDDTLQIREEKTNIQGVNKNNMVPEIIIYIPENTILDKVQIDVGINDINIEYINSNNIQLKLGVGKCEIIKMIAKKANIQGGAGTINIVDSEIGDLKLDSGVGNCRINTQIMDKSDIKAGIGKLEVILYGNEDDYTIDAKTGLGGFTINNIVLTNEQKIGHGDKYIKIKSGIGKTEVKFKD